MPVPPASRRALLVRSAGLIAATAAPAWLMPARAQGQALRPTPSQTEGPYYPVRFPADTDADLLRTGTARYGKGQAAWVTGTVTDTRGTPLAGGVVEIWQCDQDGHYYHPGDGDRADPAFQGFGQVTLGRDGRYRFRTLKPAPYSGRTPHIHVAVRAGGRDLLLTQADLDQVAARRPATAQADHDALMRSDAMRRLVAATGSAAVAGAGTAAGAELIRFDIVLATGV